MATSSEKICNKNALWIRLKVGSDKKDVVTGKNEKNRGWNQETYLHVDLFALPLTAHRIWATLLSFPRSARFYSTFSLCYFKWNPTDVRILLKPLVLAFLYDFFSLFFFIAATLSRPKSALLFFFVCVPSFPLLALQAPFCIRTFFAASIRQLAETDRKWWLTELAPLDGNNPGFYGSGQ